MLIQTYRSASSNLTFGIQCIFFVFHLDIIPTVLIRLLNERATDRTRRDRDVTGLGHRPLSAQTVDEFSTTAGD